MKVKDLIKILETCPQNATVFSTEEGNGFEIEEKDIFVETIEEILKETKLENIDENYLNGAVYIG